MLKSIDMCPYCGGAKCELCKFTGLRNESKHGKPTTKQMIAELKARRIALWKFAHSLPEDDEKRHEAEQAAKNIYDGLRDIGEI